MSEDGAYLMDVGPQSDEEVETVYATQLGFIDRVVQDLEDRGVVVLDKNIYAPELIRETKLIASFRYYWPQPDATEPDADDLIDPSAEIGVVVLEHIVAIAVGKKDDETTPALGIVVDDVGCRVMLWPHKDIRQCDAATLKEAFDLADLMVELYA